MGRTYRRDSRGRFTGGGGGGSSARPRRRVRLEPGKSLSASAKRGQQAVDRYWDEGRSPTTIGLMQRGVDRMTRRAAGMKVQAERSRRMARSMVRAGVRRANDIRKMAHGISDGFSAESRAVARSVRRDYRQSARRQLDKTRQLKRRLQRRPR